jgi:hypothetical protein
MAKYHYNPVGCDADGNGGPGLNDPNWVVVEGETATEAVGKLPEAERRKVQEAVNHSIDADQRGWLADKRNWADEGVAWDPVMALVAREAGWGLGFMVVTDDEWVAALQEQAEDAERAAGWPSLGGT